MNIRFVVEQAGRADKVLAARFPGAGRRQLAELFGRGLVRVNGRVARKGDIVSPGSEVVLLRAPWTGADRAPEPALDMALDVLYSDADLVVMNKPPGVPSHPLEPGERDTLANALVARFPECARAGADPREAGLAHRLDTGTSGVIVAARSERAWQALRAAFSSHRVEKRYLALVESAVIDDGRCDEPLVRQKNRMIIAASTGASRRDDALPASTEWRVVERFTRHALLECVTHTGRMHQVRVHLAHTGAPILGDLTYGGSALPGPMKGHFLHASRVVFPHPATAQAMVIDAPLPRDHQALLEELRTELVPE